MTLGEFLDYYLDIVNGKRESTYRGYVKAFKAFRKFLGNSLKLSDIKTDMVQRAVNELSSKLKNSSVERYFVNFKTAFKYAASPGVRYTLFNPCDGVIINKPDDVEKAVWDDDQSNQFIRFCKATKQKYAVLYVMLLKTGARIGEFLALRWTDVDLDAGVIRITRRHTHATFLLMHGHSVNAVAERLGDDPKTILKTYAHVLPGIQTQIVKTIEQLYEQ